mmetsp:Transcript_72342/g.228621  ORF Transcript_72342/g.228621 Transcript_72342/m.228621 type:complete len:209 (+) Transcript_72342:1327-1953(+)
MSEENTAASATPIDGSSSNMSFKNLIQFPPESKPQRCLCAAEELCGGWSAPPELRHEAPEAAAREGATAAPPSRSKLTSRSKRLRAPSGATPSSSCSSPGDSSNRAGPSTCSRRKAGAREARPSSSNQAATSSSPQAATSPGLARPAAPEGHGWSPKSSGRNSQAGLARGLQHLPNRRHKGWCIRVLLLRGRKMVIPQTSSPALAEMA